MATYKLDLSGERLSVTYRLTGDWADAQAKANEMRLEQSVATPIELVPEGDIRDQIVGRIESFGPVDDTHWRVRISYAIETTGFEFPQLLNVVFGNTSLQPGIRADRIDLPDPLLRAFRGPRFGCKGIRDLLNEPFRPLIKGVLKPVGPPPNAIAELAYRFALGGLDLIEDDNMLADPPFCPFKERVPRCVEAIERANRETGYRNLYVPNVTAPAEVMLERALFAKRAGAGGLLVCPGLVGFDAMRRLADDDRIALPIVNQPSLLGTYLLGDDGLSPYVLLGQITRLAGADAVLFPTYGSRFSFFKEDHCHEVVAGCRVPMGHIQPIFPVPGGGIHLERIPELASFYDCEVIFMLSTGLQLAGPDLVASCQHFRRIAEDMPRLRYDEDLLFPLTRPRPAGYGRGGEG